MSSRGIGAVGWTLLAYSAAMAVTASCMLLTPGIFNAEVKTLSAALGLVPVHITDSFGAFAGAVFLAIAVLYLVAGLKDDHGAARATVCERSTFVGLGAWLILTGRLPSSALLMVAFEAIGFLLTEAALRLAPRGTARAHRD